MVGRRRYCVATAEEVEAAELAERAAARERHRVATEPSAPVELDASAIEAEAELEAQRAARSVR